MTTHARSVTTTAPLLDRIRAEYLEMPGLSLTPAQARRLWGLAASDCASVLHALVAAGFLRQTDRGAYVRTSSHD
ncbi:MAG: hypothetical protein AB7Q15_11070 [Vicinamibacterales bacterium]